MNGVVKLCDMSLATCVKRVEYHERVRSTFWCAPELLSRDGATATTGADLWALGVTVIEMLRGKPPIPVPIEQRDGSLLIPRDSLTANLPLSDECERFLDACLVSDVALRSDIHAVATLAFCNDARPSADTVRMFAVLLFV
jgi:serine/threonine protein kinase